MQRYRIQTVIFYFLVTSSSSLYQNWYLYPWANGSDVNELRAHINGYCVTGGPVAPFTQIIFNYGPFDARTDHTSGSSGEVTIPLDEQLRPRGYVDLKTKAIVSPSNPYTLSGASACSYGPQEVNLYYSAGMIASVGYYDLTTPGMIEMRSKFSDHNRGATSFLAFWGRDEFDLIDGTDPGDGLAHNDVIVQHIIDWTHAASVSARYPQINFINLLPSSIVLSTLINDAE